MHLTGLTLAGFGLALLVAGTPASPAEPASHAKPQPATHGAVAAGGHREQRELTKTG